MEMEGCNTLSGPLMTVDTKIRKKPPLDKGGHKNGMFNATH
jgi:hypothetical protein